MTLCCKAYSESGDQDLSENELTPKQKKWLEASRKIGRVAMTKSERESLEKLYADMLPAEQMELKSYIEKNFSKKSESGETTPEPTAVMEQIEWTDPSDALKKTLSETQKPRWLKVEPE